MPSPGTATQKGLRTPNDQNRYEVTAKDEPLHCPLPGTSLWNSHPRVYVPLDKNGHGKCIYCGAEYVRVDDDG
ncbi:MAG: zinc-finger domain-containing protein [Halofilum sp. (in: g-proteobacteria)]|nr:zinc-finger domain-containing protein [Halofilum sp. (in: g-proteobacteria)]